MAAGPAFMVLAGLAMVVLAAALLVLSPGRRASRSFAYLLLIMGFALVPNWSRFLYVDPTWDAWVLRFNPYQYMAIPIAMAYFGSVYPRPRGPLGTRWWGPWMVIAAILAVDVLFLLDHGQFRDPITDAAGNPVSIRPLAMVRYLDVAVAAVVAFLLARDFARAEASPQRPSLLLVCLGFGLYAFYAALRELHYLVTEQQPVVGPLLWVDPDRVFYPPFIVVSLLTIGILVREARRSPDADVRRWARRGVAAFAGVPVVYGVMAGPLQSDSLWVVSPGIFNLALPLLVAYGLLRYRLFDIDLKMKRTIRQSTVVTSFIAVLLLTSQLGREVLAPDAALVLGILATGAFVLALARVQRFADGVAERALPGVRESPEYLDQRKVEVYRSALEQALQPDGTVAPREAAMLASLRAQLGITDRDHALLEVALRGPRAPGAGVDLEPGTVVLGRYVVQRRLGEGAHGVTALAEDRELRREVVIKALRPEKAGDPVVLREAQALSSIRHPNVVTVFDVERVGDQAFIVMEHLEGGSLQARLERGPLGAPEFARVSAGLLEALDAVHARGIVHRDVKPSNVLLTSEGQAKLADFGVAHQPGFETTAGGRDGASAVGTIRFMSPEQAKGRRVTPRSDLFSAAATLWEAFTGQPSLAPRPGESAVELQMRAAQGRAVEVPSGMPPAVGRWFRQALHRDPARRFASGRAMREALERALSGEAPAPRA